MQILLAAHPTVGHTQALRSMGAQFRRRGHGVHFATGKVPNPPPFFPTPQPLRAARDVLASLGKDGFSVIETPFSLRATFAAGRVAANQGYAELKWAMEVFLGGIEASALLLTKEIEKRGIGLVVYDYCFYGAWLAAEKAGVPGATVYHSGLPFPIPGQAPFGSGLPATASSEEKAAAQKQLDAVFARLEKGVLKARKRLGLPPIPAGLLTLPYSRDLNIITTHEPFESPRPALAEQAAGPLHWAGPCFGDRQGDVDGKPWVLPEAPQPSVYVSLGTVFNDQPDVYRTLLEGVHRAGARAVVAAGASFQKVRAFAGPNDVVLEFAPQLEVLKQVDAVIGHGGNNSLTETLCAGRPQVVVPFGAEQIANGQRVELLGVGRMLRPGELSAERLEALVKEALAAPMRERVKHLSESVPSGDGTPQVVDALERLVEPPASAHGSA